MSLPEPFAVVERTQFEWTSYLTPQALIDLVASRSYCITLTGRGAYPDPGPGPRAAENHPALVNTSGLALPYVTVGIRATLG